MQRRTIETNFTQEDSRIESTLRPQRLADYIGQSKMKESLGISIEAAKKRGEPLDHMLFYGPPGLGKTTISGIIAMEMGANMIRSGRFKRIILCGGEHMSSMVNYQDRNTCPIFGDGAGCVMMEATSEEYGLIDSYLRVDGEGFDYLHMAAGGSACMPSHETVDTRQHFVFQDGRPVFKHAVTKMSDAVETIAKRNGLTKDDIAWVIPHQANVRIETAVARRIGLGEDHVMINIDHMANTSGGTLPLCLWEFENRLHKGDNLIFTAFGAGFSWGASYMKWGYDGASEAAKEPAEFYDSRVMTLDEWKQKRKQAWA